MEKLLFGNVAEEKSCNKILFNLFVVNFKLHFPYRCWIKSGFIIPLPFPSRISILVFHFKFFEIMRWFSKKIKIWKKFLLVVWVDEDYSTYFRKSSLKLDWVTRKTWFSSDTFQFSHFYFERFSSSFSFPEMSN